ncbi:MAG: class A beta-lactamase-related serine hydrolase [Acidobacteria bacterium]|nr:MAG: class A beta-lactamase-related serine hydrolase [Acidobacteriota bacterium]REK11371.1 MAG: class A beta-lactamase-related serine hydrolase [Acidobacteriota bacterium]
MRDDLVHGHCDARFAEVAQVFERNFSHRDELGASVAITVDGETLVDLWGGHRDAEKTEPWQEDTVSVVFSCTKGAVALCAHLLVSRGELDLDLPVAEYWPEFAQQGKERTTVRMMLDHSAGVPALRDPLSKGDCCDWDLMVGRLEQEPPFWEPGTRSGYHMLTFGWTVGELVRRVADRSLGDFFRDELAEPLGSDFWIGLPSSEESRVAPVIPWRPGPDHRPTPFQQALVDDPGSLQSLALLNNGGFDANVRACRRAEIGGGGGVSNARGLARLYAPFANGGRSADGERLVSEVALHRMGRVSTASHQDATLLIGTRYALGFMKSIDNRRSRFGGRDSAILSEAAFGHVGAGGSIGFADPVAGMSFGYTMTRMGEGILLNERGQGLVDAAYRSLGYIGNESGVWRR